MIKFKAKIKKKRTEQRDTKSPFLRHCLVDEVPGYIFLTLQQFSISRPLIVSLFLMFSSIFIIFLSL